MIKEQRNDNNLAVSEIRFYVISPYHPDHKGQFTPDLPDFGPCHEWNGRPCKLGIDHFRHRKDGPCFCLCVMRCSTHGKGFTIYPPGWAPYGRKPLALLAPDGSPISSHNDGVRFRGTCFDAALDAAGQCAWPAEGNDGRQQQRFTTQVRHLHQCALLLGVAPCLHERLREETAQILDAPGQRLHDSAVHIQMQPGYQSMGQAICDILDSLPENKSVFERLAEAGAGLCLWPSPILWDERLKILRHTPYRSIRTRSSPG